MNTQNIKGVEGQGSLRWEKAASLDLPGILTSTMFTQKPTKQATNLQGGYG